MKRIIIAATLLASTLLFVLGCHKKPEVNPVALIGMDGVDWRLVRRMVARGELPNFKKFIENGTVSEMDTLEPILSPAIWNTMATGVLPEKHGITWFMVKDANGEMIPVTSAQRRTKAIWNIVSEKDRTVDVIGWWASWPAEKVNGNIISDHMGFHIFAIESEKVNTELGDTYPEKLNKELTQYKIDPFSIKLPEVRRYMNISDLEYNVSVDMKALCQRPEYKDCVYCQGKSKIPFCHFNPLHHFLRSLATLKSFSLMSEYLLKKKQPDLFMVYYEWVDTISHQYLKFAPPRMDWVTDDQYAKYSDVIRQTYIKQDEELGKLMSEMSPNTNFLIMSDHGFKIDDERLTEAQTTEVAKAHLWHHAPAFLAMMGPDIRKGGKQIKARVQDITPTILALMALPVADDMEGVALKDAINPSFLQKHPITHIPSYETKKDKLKREEAASTATGSNIDGEIKEQLKALGYIGNVDDTGIEMNRANLFMGKGNLEEAAKIGEEALAKNPANLKAILMLGDVYMKMNKFDKAVEAYSKIDKIPPSQVPPNAPPVLLAMANWGIALLNTGDLKGAEAKCKIASEKGPNNYMAFFCLGRVYELSNRGEDAIKYYNASLKINPASAEAHNNLGNCLLRKDKYKEAIEEYKKAMQANPKHVESHHNAGIAYEKLGKLEDAEREFEAALKLNPQLKQSISELGNVRMKMKKYQLAAQAFMQLSALDPNKPGPLFQAARALMAEGNVEEAVQTLKRARAINPALVDRGIEKEPLFSTITPEMLR